MSNISLPRSCSFSYGPKTSPWVKVRFDGESKEEEENQSKSSLGVVPNEASVTAVARLAAAKGDADYAFELVKGMGKYNNATPRLRTYDPALFCFCEMLDADKAYEVEEHMNGVGVSLEEAELAALLKVSARSGRVDKVYEYLHKLRSCVRCVSESTAVVVEEWFCGAKASEVGEVEFDVGQVKEGVLRNGGGWHGQGWIGKGDWAVNRTSVGADGHCCCCGEQLVCVDIDDSETEKFAGSVAGLALEREVKANFSEFQVSIRNLDSYNSLVLILLVDPLQAWLEKHDSYEAIVDGANVGLYKQNFADGGFSISQVVFLTNCVCFVDFVIVQLDCVVKELYNQSGNKWPVVVLHNKRLRGLMENPSSRKLVEEWMNNGALYTTPNGSNDDWYWLFAAVKLRCLLVTNDEMRDHIFELIGSNFFNQWKERHQVHYTFIKGNLKLQMPPSYSLVIQRGNTGIYLQMLGEMVLALTFEQDTHDLFTRVWLNYICFGYPFHLPRNIKMPEQEQ
ncbi:Proteinaceous RNase P 2 [Vigna angularis]|uniref:ribonuclease P n=1 Tax=Phaseolus angularis TaxID=3914 RepID=A0A8T0JUA1_PHAAN|nr:Proteinaceous RNase P 2 [Vigna angularis]